MTQQPTGPEAPRTVRGVLWLVAALAGTVIMAFAFVNGISAALAGDGNGAGGFVALFLLGLLLVLAALVLAIVRLARGRARVLSAITLAVALVPLATIAYLWLTA